MGRIKTPLNITRHPGVGQAYVAKRLSDGALVRVATLCTRDVKANPELAPIRKFSGTEPFFKARITRTDGGAKCDPITLVFDCRQSEAVCVATAGGITYEWLDMDHKVAVDEGLTIVNDTPVRGAKVAAVTEDENPVEAIVEETDFIDLDQIEEPVSEAVAAEVATMEESVITDEVTETPFVKKATFYRVEDGVVKTRRAKVMKSGEFASKEEALAAI